MLGGATSHPLTSGQPPALLCPQHCFIGEWGTYATLVLTRGVRAPPHVVFTLRRVTLHYDSRHQFWGKGRETLAAVIIPSNLGSALVSWAQQKEGGAT